MTHHAPLDLYIVVFLSILFLVWLFGTSTK